MDPGSKAEVGKGEETEGHAPFKGRGEPAWGEYVSSYRCSGEACVGPKSTNSRVSSVKSLVFFVWICWRVILVQIACGS